MNATTTPPPFDGQIAMVTGAAQGIGRATAELLARRGAHVVLVDLDRPGVETAARALAGSGLRASFEVADVADELQVATAVASVIEHHRRIDILAHVAGIYPYESLERTTMDQWRQVIAVNVDGTFLCCRAVAPHMKHQGYGRIVTTSSGAVLIGLSGGSAYVSSKAAVIGLTRVVAREYGEFGVTANVVMPGLIATEHVVGMFGEDFFAEYVPQQCVRRAGQPEDIANCISFLASREAGFVTGQIINCDGGLTFR